MPEVTDIERGIILTQALRDLRANEVTDIERGIILTQALRDLLDATEDYLRNPDEYEQIIEDYGYEQD